MDTKQFEHKVGVFIKEFSKTHTLMESIGRILYHYTRYRIVHLKADFKNEVPWKPRKRVYSHPLLRKTDTLNRSIDYNIDGDVGNVGTNVHYAKYHQKGTSKMVARPFLGVGESTEQSIGNVLNNYMDEKIRLVFSG